MTEYLIRKARDEDTDFIIALRLHAEQWLKNAGIEQWTTTSRGVEGITNGIKNGSTYVIEYDEATVASVTLNGPDLDFWRNSDDLDVALHPYKLMIHSDHRGIGLGDAILDWLSVTAQSRGFDLLRIDVWKTNTRLHDYYLHRGFEFVRTEHTPGRNSGALFQRPTHLRLSDTCVTLNDRTGTHNQAAS